MVQPTAESLYSLGGTRLALGDFAGAIDAYRSAQRLAPPVPSLLNNLGVALLSIGQLAEARDVLEQSLNLQPAYERARVNLAKVFGMLGTPAMALVHLHHVLATRPDYLPAIINLGDMQGACGDYAAALQTLQRAVALAPQSADAHRSLGMAHSRVGHSYDARASLETAVALKPAAVESHMALAHVLLGQGHWRDAWPHFEFRLRAPRDAQRAAPPDHARWQGNGHNEGVWLIGEQGLGDQIQFARYARLLADQGLRGVLCCDPRLVRLLSRADLRADVVPFGTPFEHSSQRWLPLLSAPAWHGTEPATVPLAGGYLRAEPERIAAWRARLPAGAAPRIAFAWRGNATTETGWFADRSPPLSALLPLLQVGGATFVSLQKGYDTELHDSLFRGRLVDLGMFDHGPDAFLDSAAILNCVDLLITSDSAIAHLAGGLGIECWLCLKAYPDWRWLDEGESSVWYDSVRLFRQTRAGDWPGVFERVAIALKKRLQASAGDPPRPGVER